MEPGGKQHQKRTNAHKNFLKQLLLKDNGANSSKRIKAASRGEICSFCEVVKNVVHNPSLGIQPTPRLKQELQTHSKDIRKLISRSVKLQEKKRILQKGKGFIIPLIAALAGPILNKILQ
jgi:neutral trehalase